MTCPYRTDIAVYLLDALEPPEAGQMREHLAICQDCRTECGELCGLPALLSTLTSADIEDIVTPAELPDDLCDAVIAKAAAYRRKHAWYQRSLAVSVALVLIVGGVLSGRAITGRQAAQAPAAAGQATAPRPAAAVTVSATDPDTHVHASASLTPNDWGTQIRLELTGVAWGQQCMLVVSSVDGQRDTAATWVATYRSALIVTGASAIPTRQISHLDIVTMAGTRLVALPPPH